MSLLGLWETMSSRKNCKTKDKINSLIVEDRKIILKAKRNLKYPSLV